MLNISYIFSYWIFIWYILYILGLTIYNPKIILYISLFVIFIEIFYLIHYKAPYKKIVVFVTINTFIKLLLILSIINTKTDNVNDILFTFLLFLIYYIYMKLNNQSIMDTYKNLLAGYISKDRNENESIFFKFFYNLIYGNS